jgi:hypothetical protein
MRASAKPSARFRARAKTLPARSDALTDALGAERCAFLVDDAHHGDRQAGLLIERLGLALRGRRGSRCGLEVSRLDKEQEAISGRERESAGQITLGSLIKRRMRGGP